MSNIAISFEHVSKMYQLGVVGTGTISNDLKRWWYTDVLGKEDPFLKIGQTNNRASKASNDFVYALRDIDFKVEQGDVVGIIGKNGAGKSTLLKLLSRITAPTTGCIKAKGRIASLLEVGTGFHPELTGRENIYLNGSIMGMTKREIDAKLDEIVDFSGCEMYIDTPTKRYSSGMQVRLGFAVAAFLEPEILVVDEVLAVGDAEFQKKAIGKMQDVSQGQGRTVLFVSHNMNSVRRLCKHGVVLQNGTVAMQGIADDCVDYYIGTNIQEIVSHCIVSAKQHDSSCYRDLEIIEAYIRNLDASAMSTDEAIEIELRIKKNSNKQKLAQFTVVFKNQLDQKIANYLSAPVEVPTDKEEFSVEIKICKHGFAKGKYNVNVAIGRKDFIKEAENFDFVEDILSFQVKYAKSVAKQEYLNWSPAWGMTLHVDENIQAAIL